MKPAALLLAAALAGPAGVAAGPAAASDSAAAPVPGEGPGRNTRHALIIGIGEYADPQVPLLRGMVHDVASARRIARAMAVPDANVRVLRDHEATADTIRAELTALTNRVQSGDRVFVYYSGHGTRWQDERASGGRLCSEGLLAADSEVLSNREIGSRLAPLARRTDKLLVFYDACFSGGVAGQPLRTRSLDLGGERVVPKFTPVGSADACAQPSNFRTRSLAQAIEQRAGLPENVVHIAASRPDEASFDSSSVGGFATAAWRDCLLGQARDLDGSGAITVAEITRCAQAKIDAALALQPGILGQHMTVAGNAEFVPAWIGMPFTNPAANPTANTGPGPGPIPDSMRAAAAANAVLAALMGLPAPATRPAVPARPAAVLAEVHHQRDGTRIVAARARQPQLKVGRDTLELELTASHDGHLYIALAGSDGQSLYLLYPNELAPDSRVRAGQRITLPGPGWEVVAAGPPGTETLLVLVSDSPRELSLLGREKSGPFMKTLLDGDGRSKLQWVLGHGAAGRSDAFGSALLTLQTVP